MEGRAVYAYNRKLVTTFLSQFLPEVVPFIINVLSRIPNSFTVMHILVIDRGIDIALALAPGAEPPEPKTMDRIPGPKSSVMDMWLLLRTSGFIGMIEGRATVAGFFFVYYTDSWRLGVEQDAPGQSISPRQTLL